MAHVEVEEHEGWSEVRLANPARRNALSTALVAELVDALQGAATRDEVVLLSAAGPVFCAGADTSEVHRPSAAPGTRLLDVVVALDAHLVALVEGPAVGAGAAVVAACPVALAEPDAWFSLPEAATGRFGAGPAPILEAVVRARTVHELALTGRRMGADEAATAGLVTAVSEPGAARAEALEVVERLAATPLVAAQGRWYWQHRFRSPAHTELRAEALGRLDRDHGAPQPPADPEEVPR